MDTSTIEAVIAFFVPLLVGILKKEGTPNVVNAAIALVVYIVFGVLGVLVSGQAIDINNLVPTITLFVTVGTVAYTLFWKNMGQTTLGLRFARK